MGGWVESMSTREIPFLLCLLTSKNSDFLYSVVNYSDFANSPNKDEKKELLQPRSPAFGNWPGGSICLFRGRGATPLLIYKGLSMIGLSFVKNVSTDCTLIPILRLGTFYAQNLAVLKISRFLLKLNGFRCNLK
jgi:hypothetical protein